MAVVKRGSLMQWCAAGLVCAIDVTAAAYHSLYHGQILYADGFVERRAAEMRIEVGFRAEIEQFLHGGMIARANSKV